MVWYLDTSAAVKLVVAEAETQDLEAWLGSLTEPVASCDLIRTELLRATGRGAPHAMTQARAVLESIAILTVPTSTFERAGDLGPTALRSLDAIHLAAALELGDDLSGLITYDLLLADAARLHGITVVAPGAHSPWLSG